MGKVIRPQYLFFILILLAVPLADAAFKQNTAVDITHPIRVKNSVISDLDANITIRDPNNAVLVSNSPMTFNSVDQEHNYTLTSGATNVLGTYSYTVTSSYRGLNKTEPFTFLITPSGDENVGDYFYIMIILAYLLFIIGLWKQDITITLLGTFSLYFIGIWVMFFGIDVFKNYLTNGFALITLGAAFYMSVVMANEYIIS